MQKQDYKPSRLAWWILEKLSIYSQRYFIKEDLEEEYQNLCQTQGKHKARRWLWRQTLLAIGFYVKYLFSWRNIMLKNYIKIALRNIKRHKGQSFINIVGLAVGMAVFILIALYVYHETSFDKYHEHADRIYRVIQQRKGNVISGESTYATTPPALAPALMDEFPEVSIATRIGPLSKVLVNYGEKAFVEDKIYCVEPETFRIFTIPFVKGDSQTALQNPYSIVLSERSAKKYFGNDNPIGRILTLREKTDFKVTGVFKNMPDNSHFVMDVVIPFRTYFLFKFGKAVITEWSNYGSFYAYCLLKEGVDPIQVEQKFPDFLNRTKYQVYPTEEYLKDSYSLQPLTSIHLHSDAQIEIGVNNNIRHIRLFSFSALLILVIACINYMNLATARYVQRSKEVGIRKVIGASRGQLIRQFIGESVLTTLVSLTLALLIVLLALPAFNTFIGRQLNLNLLGNFQLLIVITSVILFVGLLSGIYPALFISSLKPVISIKGHALKSTKNDFLRNGLVTAQFAITTFLIIGTLVVKNQIVYILNKDMGYKKEQIVVLHTGDIGTRDNFHNKIRTIKSELTQNLNIISVSGSKRLPNYMTLGAVNILPGKETASNIPVYAMWGDDDFIDVYGIEITAGRNFSQEYPADRKGAILINETAAKACRWEDPIGKILTYWGNRTGVIVGIMKDFHFHPIHRPIEPLCIYYEPLYFDYLSIKIRGSDIPKTIAHIERTMKKFSPNHPFEYQFFDEIFDRTYQTEQKTGEQFSVITILSILIACMGLFGLALFTTQQRTKEIGIRKVMGASVKHIMFLFTKEFLKWILVANLVAWPVAYLVMNRWLQNFAFRIHIGWFHFLVTGAISFAIALTTVSYQVLKTATANPVDSLRHE
jgi:putative ABC transport system permease protein